MLELALLSVAAFVAWQVWQYHRYGLYIAWKSRRDKLWWEHAYLTRALDEACEEGDVDLAERAQELIRERSEELQAHLDSRV